MKQDKHNPGHLHMVLAVFEIFISVIITGCTQEPVKRPEEYPILFSAAAGTRAPINTISDLAQNGDKVGIYGVITGHPQASSLLTYEWDEPLLMNNIQTRAIDLQGSVVLPDTYLYPINEKEYVKFMAYYPYSQTAAPPYVPLSATGQNEILWADPVTGNRLIPFIGLNFNHSLTQLRFAIADASGAMSGISIHDLTFTGTNTRSTLNVETGRFGEWTHPVDTLSINLPEPVIITGTPASPQMIGESVLLQPDLESFTIFIQSSLHTFPNVTITPSLPDTRFEAGRSYLITITFYNEAIFNTKATIIPWQNAGTGDSNIH